MKIRKNLLFSVVVGLGFFPLLTITKPAEAFTTYCSSLAYTAGPPSNGPPGTIPINTTGSTEVNTNIKISNIQPMPPPTNGTCSDGSVAKYETSDLTFISLALKFTAKGKSQNWLVTIGNSSLDEKTFQDDVFQAFSMPDYSKTGANLYTFRTDPLAYLSK